MGEKIITLFFIIGSISYLFFAQQLSFGTIGSPKSGFLPILAGIVTSILSLVLMFKQLRLQQSTQEDKVDWTKFLFIIIGLLVYLTILNIIGYFAATFIVLFYLFKMSDNTGWIFPLMIALSSSAIFYLLFHNYLAVPLP